MLAGLVVLAASLSPKISAPYDDVFVTMESDGRSGSVTASRDGLNGSRVLVEWKGRPAPVQRVAKEIRVQRGTSILFYFRQGRNDQGQWRASFSTKGRFAPGHLTFLCSMGLEDGEVFPFRHRLVARRKGRTELSFAYAEPGRPPTRRFSIPILVR